MTDPRVTDSWTTGTVANGASTEINRQINASLIDLLKIKVVQNAGSGSSKMEIFEKDTFLVANLVYRTSNFSGTHIDPIEDDNDVLTERTNGEPIPYYDADETNELHLKITNNDSVSKTYTVTIVYRMPLVAI